MENSQKSNQLAMFEPPKAKVKKVVDEKKQKIVKVVIDQEEFNDDDIRKDLSSYCTIDVKIRIQDDEPYYMIYIYQKMRDETGEDIHGGCFQAGGSDHDDLLVSLLATKVEICANFYCSDRSGICVTRIKADRIYTRFSELAEKQLRDLQWNFDRFWKAWNSITQESATEEIMDLFKRFDEYVNADLIRGQLSDIEKEIELRFNHCSPQTYREKCEQGFAPDVARKINGYFDDRNKNRPYGTYAVQVLEKMYEKLVEKYYQHDQNVNDARNRLWELHRERIEQKMAQVAAIANEGLVDSEPESVCNCCTREGTENDIKEHESTHSDGTIMSGNDMLDAMDMPDFKIGDHPDLVEFEKARIAEKPLKFGLSYTVRVIKENDTTTGNVQVRSTKEGFDIFWVVYGHTSDSGQNKEYLLDGNIDDELCARVKSYLLADRLQKDLEEFKTLIANKEKVEIAKVEVFKI